MRWPDLNIWLSSRSRLCLFVAAFVAISTWPQAGHAGALIFDSRHDVEILAAPPSPTPRGTRMPQRSTEDSGEKSRPLEFESSLKGMAIPLPNASAAILTPGSAFGPFAEPRFLPATTSMQRTDGIGRLPGSAQPGRSQPTTADEDRESATIRDMLRSYVNARNSSKPPAARRAIATNASPLESPGTQDSFFPGVKIGRDIRGEILALPADSLLGEIIFTVFEPTVELDSTVTFSILGLGRFLAERSPSGSAIRVVDLGAGYTLIQYSQDYSVPSRSQRAGGRKKVSVSIINFLWSMLGELARTPIFYVIILAVLGWSIYARTKAS